MEKKKMKRKFHAFRFLILLTVIVFLVEMTIMVSICRIKLPTLLEAFVDSFVLIIVSFPFLYVFSYRPLVSEISQREKVEEELRKSYLEVNRKVEEQTKELFLAKEFSENILNSMSEGLDIVDENCNILFMNKVFKDIFGSNAIGRKCFEVYRKDHTPCESCPVKDKSVFRGDSVPRDVVSIVGDRTFMVSHTLMKNSDGTSAVLEVFRDISERKKAEEALKKYAEDTKVLNKKVLVANEELEASLHQLEAQRQIVLFERNKLNAVIQSMGEGLMVIGRKKEIQIINARMEEFFGLKSTENTDNVYFKSLILKLWKELDENQGLTVKKEIVLERPREKTFQVVLAPLSGAGAGDREGFVAIFRDISLEKKAAQLKSDFVADITHEIRSPMAPMKDALSLMADESAGPLNAQQKKFLDMAMNNIERLIRLINNLLDLSKIEAGKLELNKTRQDITKIANEITESVRSHAGKKQIALYFETDHNAPEISFDKDRITEVVYNLLMNAIKFTPAEGRIAVRSAVLADSIEISISDSGPGLTAQEADGLFTRFSQLKEGARLKGTGLGLAISKAIIEMHGGKIWVESLPGQGSTFKFTLPTTHG